VLLVVVADALLLALCVAASRADAAATDSGVALIYLKRHHTCLA
jgi:hypothetical protein